MGGNSKRLAQPQPAREPGFEPNRVDRVVRHLTDRENAINTCVNVLAHTLSHCPSDQRVNRNRECKDVKCQKMQSVLRHVSKCAEKSSDDWFERAQSGGCKVCLQFMSLQIFHTKRCRRTRCCFNFCEPLKMRLSKILQNRLKTSALCCSQFPIVDLKQF